MNEMGRVQQFVSDRPQTSLMAAFGVGFGLGLLVTLLLNREQESWFERYAPDALQDLPDRFQHAKHKVASAMPSSFKQVGESLASYVPSSWKRW
jgi:ribosomal protein S17E